MRKQLHAYFSGRVQGIGFRFTAVNIANSLGVCGAVRNLGDGRVEIFAEAEEGILKEFLKKIQEQFSRYIQDSQIDWQEATGKFDDFGVAF